MKFFFFFFFFLSASAFASSPRTVMVQLFNWPWNAVAEECERELGPAGYSAVQISPPQEHVVVPGAPWWERYQPASYRLESRSGTQAELVSMVKRCARAGVDIYADVVLNHMNSLPSGVGFAGSHFSHYEYEGLWGYNDFHHCGRNGDDGLRDFTDLFELQNCELLGMSDLNTGSDFVQGRQAFYLNRLMDLGIRGFRVDAAKHISPRDLQGIFGRLPRPNYRVLELIVSPGEPIRVQDYLPVGDINNFAYAYMLGDAFAQRDLARLPGLAGRTGIGTNDASVFLENHDLERRPDSENLLAHRRDRTLHRLGTVFLLTWPYGYPAIYSGYDFSDFDRGPPLDFQGRVASPLVGGNCVAPWTCVHRGSWLRALVDFRNRTDKIFGPTQIWAPTHSTLTFGRGDAGHVVISLEDRAQKLEINTQLRPGRYCNLAADDPQTDCATVDPNRVLRLEIGPRSAFVALDEERVNSRHKK